MINVSEVIIDPEFVQTLLVKRNSGYWYQGRFVKDNEEMINISGVVTQSKDKEIRQLPEADEIIEARTFHTVSPVYLTEDTSFNTRTSDRIFWRNKWYKIIAISNKQDYGYYKSIGARMKGD